MMAVFYVYVEVVNYDATIFDTTDLSSIRGASHAANLLPVAVVEKLSEQTKPDNCDIIVRSASHALAKFEFTSVTWTKDQLEKAFASLIDQSATPVQDLALLLGIAEKDQLWHMKNHLCLTWAVDQCGANDDFGSVLNRIQNTKTRRQLHTLSTDLPEAANTPQSAGTDDKKALARCRPCEKDGFRPRHVNYWLPDHQAGDSIAAVSRAIAWRRHFGRALRRSDFYTKYLGAADLEFKDTAVGFSDSFEELVEVSKDADGYTIDMDIPDQMKNKVAILSMDMTGLGAQAAGNQNSGQDYKSFSAKQRQALLNLLKSVAEKACTIENMILQYPKKAQAPDGKTIDGRVKRSNYILRLETLMLGGDEILFIFPAWCAEDILAHIAKTIQDEEFNEEFNYGAGLVICHHKTPIRLSRDLANSLCESAKRGAESAGFSNGLQYHIAGHLEFPDADLGSFRKKVLFGSENTVRNALTLNLETIADTFDALRLIKGESGNGELGIARGQIVNVVRSLILNGQLFDNRQSLEGESTPYSRFVELITGNKYKKFDGETLVPIEVDDVFCDSLRGHDNFPSASLFHTLWLWSMAKDNAA